MKKTWIISAAFCAWVLSASAQIVSPVSSRDNLAGPQNASNQPEIAVSGTEPSVASLYTANLNQLGPQLELEELDVPPTTPASAFNFADTGLVPTYTAHVPEPPSILAAMALLVPLSVSLLRVLRKKEVS